MDKFAEQLRTDAANIDAAISSQLDERIQTSLAGIEPHNDDSARRSSRPYFYWWSGGLAVAATVLAVMITLNPPDSELVQESSLEPVVASSWDLNKEVAALAGPLHREMDNLQADIYKVGEILRDDIALNF